MRLNKTTLLTIAADGVGMVSTVLGGLLTVAPRRSGRSLGLVGTDVTCRRALGVADLSLGIAIMAGRSRPWRWSAVAARSMLHLVFAGEYIRSGRRRSAAGMCALFAIDAGIAAGLRERTPVGGSADPTRR
ncbi:MAG: hypothetical protein ACQEWM_06065 [Actinomycetota bacterium]